MIELSGYQMVDIISNNGEIEIYRLLRQEDRVSVIAMTTCDEYPGPAMIKAFRYEYEILTRLNGRGTLDVYSLEIMPKRPVLLLLDIGGGTLDWVLRTRANRLELSELIRIAVNAVDSLMQIHRNHITLNEVTPFHLIVNPDTFEVRFIDIRMCSTDSDKSPLPLPSDRPDWVLPYISPEQTGRTEMTPDYRSDFYSLGVMLYEWFSGSLPFEFKNTLDIVYHHLASKPEPLNHRFFHIPKSVSDIIAKSMEKMPEARYASAFGMKSDLEECLVRCQVSGEMDSFVLASHDISERWVVPSHMYGRQAEQQTLREALQRATNGTTEIVWISGRDGIGKTFFVKETLRKAVPFEGFLAIGTIDSHHNALPYDIWIQVIDQLVSQLLMEDNIQLEVWKLRIIHAVDSYGQLLIELVPKLELLIGQQPDVLPLPPVEAQRRLHILMNRFIQLFLHRNYPLVLVIDDLQWADEASLQYLTYLVEDRETKHLLVTLLCRDGEITPEHPLSRWKKHLEDRGTSWSNIFLKALEVADLHKLLTEAKHDDVDMLATVLFQKTEGIPLFLNRFIQDLIDNKQVTFDELDRCWRWDLQLIKEMSVPDHAVNYLTGKLKLLPDQMMVVLSRAAVLGRSFDLDTLFFITGIRLEVLTELLSMAVREYLLQPVSSGNDKEYRFQHERIQQVAYSLVPEAERPDLHLKIGSLLVHRLNCKEEVNIFEAVNHLNQAWERMDHTKQKLEVAILNLQVGLKAKQSTAYETSLKYLRHATELLGGNYWDRNYTLTFRSFLERAEVEYLCSHFEQANELFDVLMSKAKTNLDQALVCNVKIKLESAHDNYEEVISLGRKTLQLLNVRYNFNPSSVALTQQWVRFSRKIRKHPIETISHLPPMTDEARKVAMSALVEMGNACFLVNKKAWLALTFTMVEMTLDYGITPEASIGFVGYAMFLSFHSRNDKEASKWGTLACRLSKPYPKLHVKTLSSFSLCYDSWRQYDPQFIDTFTEYAGKVGLESGDLWHGNQSVLINCGLLLQYGYPLGMIYDRLIAHSEDFLRHNNSLHWKQATISVALLVRLIGYRAPDDPFDIDHISSDDFAASVHGDEFNVIQELVCTLQYLPGYLFGQYREANEALKKAAAILESRNDGLDNPVQYTYESLVRAQLYEEATYQEKKEFRVSMHKRLKQLKPMAERCPNNYLHKYLLIKAEIARLAQRNRQAEELYEQSIEAAAKYGLIHDRAIAAECYGRYGLSQGKQQLAKIYLTEAYECYLQWGAAAKAADLERKYGHLIYMRRESGLENVDSLSIVMSAQALSGEMEMNRLLDTLMRIMLHNVGAEYGAIIFDHEDRWTVEAYGTADEQHIKSVPLQADSDLVPAAIIGYAARTQEEIVLHNAASEGMFMHIPYVRNNGLKSVLCFPILYHNKLVCVLYMENRLSAGVFTPQRLDVIKLLGSQCAISIANAQLYSRVQFLKDNLEEQVEERTRSLERSICETSAALADASVYEERNRIAHEIHDIVGHTLTSTLLQIEAGKRLIHRDTEGAIERLKEAQDLVRHSLNEIRGSIHMLKKDKYVDLASMLNQLIRDTERNMGVKIHAACYDVPELPTVYKKTIYHALQEGLTNGIRHGESKEFHFSLELVGSTLQFRLEDCGIGSSHIVMGFGLKAMKDRVEQTGGSLSIDSRRNQGCLLRIELPYPTLRMGDCE